MSNEDRPDIAERYATACNSSNLRVEAERGSSADILIAAGWLPSRAIGAVLLRLHTKYTRDGLEYVHEEALALARKAGIIHAEAVTSAVLAWWFERLCKTCEGVKFTLIPGTPSLSAKHCSKCKGTGEINLPHGEAGKKMARWLDESVERARASIRSRLYAAR